MLEKDSLKELMKKRNGQLAALLESVNGNGNGNGNGGNGTGGKKQEGNGGK